MTKMYVANTSQQNLTFTYTLAERNRPIAITVRQGGQVCIPHELTPVEVQQIVDQHLKYGFVHVKDIQSGKKFNGYCYDLDRPIKVDAIRAGLIHNRDVLIERGKQIRAESAVALNDQIEQVVGEKGLAALEVSVEEVKQGDRPDDVDAIHEVLTVSRDPNVAPPSGTRSSKSKGGAKKSKE